METMTLLKWQLLQQQTRNETKIVADQNTEVCNKRLFYPRMEHSRLTTSVEQLEQNYHNIQHQELGRPQCNIFQTVSHVSFGQDDNDGIGTKPVIDNTSIGVKHEPRTPSPAIQFNNNNNYNSSCNNNNNSSNSNNKNNKTQNLPSPYSVSLFPRIRTTSTTKSESENSTQSLQNYDEDNYNDEIRSKNNAMSMNTTSTATFDHSPINHTIISLNEHRGISQESSKPFPRFGFHSDPHQTTNNPINMRTSPPTDLSKSFPPYNYIYTPSDAKSLSSASRTPTPPTPQQHAPLSSPLSSPSSLSLTTSLSLPSSSTTPFRLFSMQPSSLFPISFPTTNTPTQSASHSQILQRDNIPTQHSSLINSPLTPPPPPHPSSFSHPFHTSPLSQRFPITFPPTPHHKQQGGVDNSPSFKRRHSTTAPLLVDPNIPFTTYLQNLTKTLQESTRTKSTSSSSHYSSTSSTHSNKSSSNSELVSQPEPDSSSSSHSHHFKQNHHNQNCGNNYNNNNNDDKVNDEDDDKIDDRISSYDENEVGKQKDVKNYNVNNHMTDTNIHNEDEEENAVINITTNDEEENGNDYNYKEMIRDDNINEDNDDNHYTSQQTIKQSHTSGKHWKHTNNNNIPPQHRRNRRVKRQRYISELFIPREKDEELSIKEGQEVEQRHPLSAPIFPGVSPATTPAFPQNPATSLYQHLQQYQEASGKSLLQQQHPQQQPPHPHHHHHQQQQQHQQHPHQSLPNHWSMSLGSLTGHPSPPPLFISRLPPSGSQYSPSHVYTKLFPGLATAPPHQAHRLTDLHASLRGTAAGVTAPGTSNFFTSSFLGLGGLGMRRSSSDKPPPVKKYKCDVCQKAFSRSNTLVTHKRIHTGDKPFKCEVCGRAFRQPGNLTRHRLTHTTHKPYVCHVCGKAFNRASNLNTHIRTHNSFRQFGCTVCPKTSYHHHNKAELINGGDRTYKCDICGRRFAHTTTLLAHRRTHASV